MSQHDLTPKTTVSPRETHPISPEVGNDPQEEGPVPAERSPRLDRALARGDPDTTLMLQRLVGNQAVQRMLAQSRAVPRVEQQAISGIQQSDAGSELTPLSPKRSEAPHVQRFPDLDVAPATTSPTISSFRLHSEIICEYWVNGRRAVIGGGNTLAVSNQPMQLPAGTSGRLQLHIRSVVRGVSRVTSHERQGDDNIVGERRAILTWPVSVDARGNVTIPHDGGTLGGPRGRTVMPLPAPWRATQADRFSVTLEAENTRISENPPMIGVHIAGDASSGGNTGNDETIFFPIVADRNTIVTPAPSVQMGPGRMLNSATVYFRVDDDELEDSQFDELLRWYDSLTHDDRENIASGHLPVHIEGHASAPGPVQHNFWLAGQRQNVVRQFIQVQHPNVQFADTSGAHGEEGSQGNELREDRFARIGVWVPIARDGESSQ